MKKGWNSSVLQWKKILTEVFTKRSSLIIIICFLLAGVIGFVLVLEKQQTANTRAATLVNCNISSDKIAMDAEEQAFLSLINAYRQSQGNNAGPLKISYSLTQAAAWMANDQSVKGSFDPNHIDTLGRQIGTRQQNCGYSYNGAWEDAVDGATTAKAALNIWTTDKSHNNIMINPGYTVIGIARDFTSSGKAIWVVDFGSYDDSSQQSSMLASDDSGASPVPSVQPKTPAPTVYCLGSCPIPTLTTLPAPSTIVTSPQPSISQIAPTIDPCASEAAIQQYTTSKKHGHNPNRPGGEGGFIGLFLEVLQLFFEWIMHLLGANPPTAPEVTPVPGQPVVPTTSPCVPTPTLEPELTSSPALTPTLALTVAPTTGITSAPVTSPTIAPTTGITSAPTDAQPTSVTSPKPTIVTSPQPSISQIAPTIDPCASEAAIQQYTASGHNHNPHRQGGFIGLFLQILQLFLNWIMQLLGIHLSTTPQVTPTPEVGPTTQPVDPTNSPTNSPCIATPTLQPTNTPTTLP